MISVIIPCYPPHIELLLRCLQSTAGQTLKPDQVIICLSEANSELARGLERLFSPLIPVQVIETTEKQTAGQNRNRGLNVAKGDIVAFIDADDIMHPQRLEIMQKIIASKNSSLVLHDYSNRTLDFNYYDLSNLKIITANQILEATFGSPPVRNIELETGSNGDTNLSIGITCKIQHGCVAVKRDDAKAVGFTDMPMGEDGRFCRDMLWKYRNATFVAAKLVDYWK
jgi:glycosyltransferase involved in cell wall biosynthesis